MRNFSTDLYRFSELSKEVQKPIFERRKKYRYTEPPFFDGLVKQYEQVFKDIGFTQIKFYIVHGWDEPAWTVSSKSGVIDVYAMSLSSKVLMPGRDRRFIQNLKNHLGDVKAHFYEVHHTVEYWSQPIHRNKMLRVEKIVYEAVKPFIDELKAEYKKQKELLKTKKYITKYLDGFGEIFTKEGKVLYIEERF